MFPDIFYVIFHKRSKSYRVLIFQVETRHRYKVLNPLVYVLEVLKKKNNKSYCVRAIVKCTKLTLQSLTPIVLHNVRIHTCIGLFAGQKGRDPLNRCESSKVLKSPPLSFMPIADV